MKNSLFAIFSAMVLASCSTSYSIKGTSDVSMLDGHKLYLKALKGDEIKNIDSCDVVHGQFQFNGQLDTIKVGAVFLDNESLMPVVLEEGDLEMTINQSRQRCTGSPLNDLLTDFMEKFNQIANELGDLEHQHSQAIMDGKDMQVVNRELQQKQITLLSKQEKTLEEFIVANFDNVLGPFAFQMVTGGMQYPMYSPWIEALLSKATDNFKNDRYVKEFIQAAERNRDIMTGMEEPTPTPSAPNAPAVPETDITGVPTPNELATPQQ